MSVFTLSAWTICRRSHIKRGSSTWRCLMRRAINDSPILLEAALRRCRCHLSNPRMSEHGSLSSKVKCQMLSMYAHGERPSTPLGARRPCCSAGDGKTPLRRSFHFGARWLSRAHHGNRIIKHLFLLYLIRGGYESAHTLVLDKRICCHVSQIVQNSKQASFTTKIKMSFDYFKQLTRVADKIIWIIMSNNTILI